METLCMENWLPYIEATLCFDGLWVSCWIFNLPTPNLPQLNQLHVNKLFFQIIACGVDEIFASFIQINYLLHSGLIGVPNEVQSNIVASSQWKY